MKNIEVGKLIKYNRARRGFKQKELAKLIYVDAGYLGKMETGHVKVGDYWIEQIAKVLKMRKEDLIKYNPELYKKTEPERLYNARLAEDQDKIIYSANSVTALSKKTGIPMACISRAINNKAKDNYVSGYIITTIRDN